MENTVILLNGYPATGKLTIAKELCDMTGAVLVDNHLINTPIFAVVGADGKSNLPNEVKSFTRAIRRAVYEAMVRFAPVDKSFVLTGCLYNEYEPDKEWLAETVAMAKARRAKFAVIKLTCKTETLMARVVGEDRKGRKLTNPDHLKKEVESYTLMNVREHENFELDVSDLIPRQSAEAILSHMNATEKRQPHA